MPTWNPNNVILTTEGQRVLALLSTGKGSIHLTKVGVGLYVDSTNPDLVDLPNISEIPNIATNLKSDIVRVDANGNFSNVEISIENTEDTVKLTKFCQIGIYAKYSEEGTEFLYMVAQCDSGEYEQLPAYSETPTALFYNLKVYHGYSEGMTAQIAENSYIDPYRVINLEAEVKSLSSKLEVISNRKLYIYVENIGGKQVSAKFHSNSLNEDTTVAPVKVSENYYCCGIPLKADTFTLAINGVDVGDYTAIPPESLYSMPLLIYKGTSTYWADYTNRKFKVFIEAVSGYEDVENVSISLSYTIPEGDSTVDKVAYAQYVGKVFDSIVSDEETFHNYFAVELPINTVKVGLITFKSPTSTANYNITFNKFFNYTLVVKGVLSDLEVDPNKHLFTSLIKGISSSVDESYFTRIVLSNGELIYDDSETLTGYSYAFSLKEVQVGTCCKSILGAFGFTTVEKVTIPNTVESISANSLMGAKEVYINNYPSALHISKNAFRISKVCFAYDNPTDYNLFFVGNECFKDSRTELTSPPNGIKSSEVTKIIIGSKVTKLNDNAFTGCTNLNTVEIIDGVDLEIGSYAFYQCPNLTSITIPSRVIKIGSNFLQCSNGNIVTVYIDSYPGGIDIDKTAFIENHKVYFKYMPEQGIVDNAMSATSSNAVANKVVKKYIDNKTESTNSIANKDKRLATSQAVYDYVHSQIPEIDLELSTTSKNPLSNSEITNYLINNDLVTLVIDVEGNIVFFDSDGTNLLTEKQFRWNTEVKEVYIGSANKYVPDECFSGCSNLEKLVIKKGVNVINANAFWNVTNLAEVVLPSSLNHIGSTAFGDNSSSCNTTIIYLGEKSNLSLEEDSFTDGMTITYREAYTEGDIVLKDTPHRINIPAHYRKEGSKVTVYFSSLSAEELIESGALTTSSVIPITLPFTPVHEFAEVINVFNNSEIPNYNVFVKELVRFNGSTAQLMLDTVDEVISFTTIGIKGGIFTYFTSE